MNSIEEKMIRTLQKIGEDIETISLTDCDAWKKICTDLERDIRDIPEDMSGLLKLLGFCLKGLSLISEKSVTDPLSLVVAISDALFAAEQYLLAGPDRDLVVREAGQALGSALNNAHAENEITTVINPVPSEEVSILSLDDAAAFLIQLESNDFSSLSCLLEALNTFAADESYSVSSRDNILQAAQKIETIIETSVSDPDLTIDEIGKLIEKAINSMDENQMDEEIKTPIDSISNQAKHPTAENVETDYMPEDVDLDLLDEFITEGNELVLNAEDSLLSLEIDPDDTDAVGTVFRAFHSMKGTAAFLDLSLISEMGHYAESLLSRVRDREIRYSGGYADLSLRALDMFKVLISSVQKALGGNPFFKPEGYDELLGLLADPEKAGISDETDESTDILLRTGDILVAQGKVEREQIEKLASRQDDGPIGMKLLESEIASVTDVAHALRTGEQMKGAKQEFDSSIRVNIKRLDQLIDMVGELVIGHSMVAQDEVVVNGNHHDLLKKITHTNKIVRELQDISMSMRMIPLKSTFRKMD
ncbi:MAG: Hpt domain-containing protein [Deltaproteobacteria bacterium]|nr:Hpt domain-containing protein [Deltaproteobacteria bacterium]